MTEDLPNTANVRRILLRAKPGSKHPKFEQWETANICVFVRDDDPQKAVHRALAELSARAWDVLEIRRTDTLIEERVRAEGGDVWEAYLAASRGQVYMRTDPERPGLMTRGQPRFLPMEIDESLFDQIVKSVGGQRITELVSGEAELNADYLIGNTVFELKTLEEDGLQKRVRQEKLAELFTPYYSGMTNALIDAEILSEVDRRTYLDIVGSPIKAHVKKAAKQVKSTKALLGRANLRGGLIVLNTGFPALSHDIFFEQVARYAAKDTDQFDDVISIAVWVETNGFDSVVNFRFEPSQDGSPDVDVLRTAFHERFEKIMTDLMRGDQDMTSATMTPSNPAGFSLNGLVFRWEPHTVPLSIDPTTP